MATVQTSRAIAKARFRVFDFGALEDLEEERAARLVGILWVGLVWFPSILWIKPFLHQLPTWTEEFKPVKSPQVNPPLVFHDPDRIHEL